MSRFRKGDTPYINDCGWRQVRILRAQGDYYIVRRLDRECAFGCSEHRLISETEYQQLVSSRAVRTNYLPPQMH